MNESMGIHNARAKSEADQSWHFLDQTLVERIPISYGLIIGILALIALTEQAFEHYLHDPSFTSITFTDIARRLVLLVLLVYMLSLLKVFQRRAVRGLVQLRQSVLVRDAEFEKMARQMLHIPLKMGIGIPLPSNSIVLVLFVFARFW
jgi:hypothetical protein